MKALHLVTFILIIIGALNWGLIGLMGLNLVNVLLGMWPMVESIVYVLVGLSAIYELFTHMSRCKDCSMKKK